MQIIRMSRAPACDRMVERRDGAAAGRQHRIDHQDDAAAQALRAASSSTATRSPCSRRAAGRCGRRARPESARGSRRACPSPARSTGTTTTSADTRRPSAAPSGVCTVTGEAGRSRVASAASSRLMRTAIRRNSSGGVRASRSVTSASWTSGCSTTWTDTEQYYLAVADWRMRGRSAQSRASVSERARAGARRRSAPRARCEVRGAKPLGRLNSLSMFRKLLLLGVWRSRSRVARSLRGGPCR